MPSFLSTSELFQDRIELTGYATLILSALGTIVYFGLLFFYAPVQAQSLLTKLGVLLSGPVIFTLAWWLPKHKNWSRLVMKFFFLGFGCFAAFETFSIHHWAYALGLGYAFFGYWVLSHPAAIAVFRPLSEAEFQTQENATWFSLFTSYFIFQAGYVFCQGWIQLDTSEPLNGFKSWGWALLAWILIFFVKRKKAWARWSLVILMLAAALAHLPETFTSHSYWAYWKALADFSLYSAFALYLLFSPLVRQFFAKKPPRPQ
jgi:hypothetical protein